MHDRWCWEHRCMGPRHSRSHHECGHSTSAATQAVLPWELADCIASGVLARTRASYIDSVRERSHETVTLEKISTIRLLALVDDTCFQFLVCSSLLSCAMPHLGPLTIESPFFSKTEYPQKGIDIISNMVRCNKDEHTDTKMKRYWDTHKIRGGGRWNE